MKQTPQKTIKGFISFAAIVQQSVPRDVWKDGEFVFHLEADDSGIRYRAEFEPKRVWRP